MIYALRLRLARWISPEKKNAAVDHVAGLKDISSLELAIDIVAEAMPSNCAIHDDVEQRKAMLRGIIEGKSATISCDWEIHPTHCVVATTQPNGRALFTIHVREEYLKKGSQ